ncbi:zinc finger protein 764-like [Diabrotica virgifera virgifera]|uniref:Zinc finger protein 764-like n=1 Tax=Diabrotica virgifera virgifera TaxID=50390 RepID=A0A6P7G9B6_DIAVI|nr:zinc finger protein 764-like [Diabrotica virgifera virgifera]
MGNHRYVQEFALQIFTPGQDEIFRHICFRCGSSYKHLQSLKRHLRYECGQQPTIPCPGCFRKFKYPSDMKMHLSKNRCPKNRLGSDQ